MPIEYLRGGQNLAGYKSTLERVTSGFGERANMLRSQDTSEQNPEVIARKERRAERLGRHVDRLRGEISLIGIEEEAQQGVEPQLQLTAEPIPAPPSVGMPLLLSEETRRQYILQSGFQTESLEEISKVIGDIYSRVSTPYSSEIYLYDLYSEFAQELPTRISTEANQRAIAAIATEDTDQVRIGAQVLIALNLKTIMAVIESYLTKNADVNNELVQHVLMEVSKRTKRFHDRYAITIQVNNISRRVAGRFIAQQFDIPSGWVDKGVYTQIIQAVDKLFIEYPRGLDSNTIDFKAAELSAQYNISENALASYIIRRREELQFFKPPTNYSDPVFDKVFYEVWTGELRNALNDLSPEERYILRKIFFEESTYKAIADNLNDVSPQQAWLIAKKALKKLRRSFRGKFR